jgi:hypothetical protein
MKTDFKNITVKPYLLGHGLTVQGHSYFFRLSQNLKHASYFFVKLFDYVNKKLTNFKRIKLFIFF